VGSFCDYEKSAMLDLPVTERASTQKRFEEISAGFSVLDSFATDGVPPLVTVLEQTNVMREDISSKFMPRDELLKNAPDKHDGYFRVPAAIE